MFVWPPTVVAADVDDVKFKTPPLRLRRIARPEWNTPVDPEAPDVVVPRRLEENCEIPPMFAARSSSLVAEVVFELARGALCVRAKCRA